MNFDVKDHLLEVQKIVGELETQCDLERVLVLAKNLDCKQ